MVSVNILQPISISTILIGAMMPYAFSALTMQSVGSAAAEMVSIKKIILY
jgi:Na+/H+-translocating membrane pyrophosphatase